MSVAVHVFFVVCLFLIFAGLMGLAAACVLFWVERRRSLRGLAVWIARGYQLGASLALPALPRRRGRVVCCRRGKRLGRFLALSRALR